MPIFTTVTPPQYRTIYMNAMYPFIKCFTDLNGFVAAHAGSGFFTGGYPQGLLSTGTTIGSRGLAYSANPLFLSSANYTTYFEIRSQPRIANTGVNSFYLIGLNNNPTNPVLLTNQVNFRISNGQIFIACSDGISVTNVNTGLIMSDFIDLRYIIQHGPLGTTFTITDGSGKSIFYTNLISNSNPNNAAVYATLYISNQEAVEKNMWYFPMVTMQA